QALLARRSVEEGWSVRDLEKNLKLLSRVPRKKRATRSAVSDAHLLFVTEQLQRRFGTSVRIFPCRALANGRTVKGTVEIDFFSNDDLNRILDLLGVTESP
ncbi:MAG: chromosome partitioning protein ParB, partial [Lentisphaerae bacterium]|nr:chromosome partitioning protein ParB [Lentisphaerota bacterium]